MDNKDKYDEYLEKLLLLQYEASKIFNHKPTKGDVREEFIKHVICSQYNNAKLYKGAIVSTGYQSSQIDLVAVSQNSSPRIRSLGNSALIDIKDAKLIVEVKSIAKTSELCDLNKLAKDIKEQNEYIDAKVGMFIYEYQIKKENMLKKFGYKYDAEIDSYIDEATIEFPNIDFLVSIDSNSSLSGSSKGFFLVKDSNTNRFILFLAPPTSKHFIELFGF